MSLFDPQNQLNFAGLPRGPPLPPSSTNPTSHQFVSFPAVPQSKARRPNNQCRRHAHAAIQTSPPGKESAGPRRPPPLFPPFSDPVTAARRAAPRGMASRRDAPLMRGGGGGGGGQPLSRGSRIAAAVVVGVTLGCLCAFFYPDGLFSRASDSATHWPRRVRTRVSAPSLSLSFCTSCCSVRGVGDEGQRSEGFAGSVAVHFWESFWC